MKDGLSFELLEKLRGQIPAIVQGVEQWQVWAKQRIEIFVDACQQSDLFAKIDAGALKTYITHYVLPSQYWKVILHRTPPKLRNRRLRKHYQKQAAKWDEACQYRQIGAQLSEEEKIVLVHWVHQIARSFQRSSSQVEGRNGFLAFMHKANRGLSQQRLKVLGVVHNFDTRGQDGRVPTQRLFQRAFPDLFEFILKGVDGFPEPRGKKHNTLGINFVAA